MVNIIEIAMSDIAKTLAALKPPRGFVPTGEVFVNVAGSAALATTEAQIFSIAMKRKTRVTEIAVYGDANAISGGSFSIRVGGKVITNPDGTGHITLLANIAGIDIDLKGNNIILDRTQLIEVWGLSSVASSNIQLMIVGEFGSD